METVILKNGAEEVKVSVAAHIMSLESLMDESTIAFGDLVRKCRDRTYEVSDGMTKFLQSRGFLQGPGGTVHDSTENIVFQQSRVMDWIWY